MKTAILFSLIASAPAFAPLASKPSTIALNGDARSPDGLGVDLGLLDLFDPLGFVNDVESFPRCCAVEIKHGRICMMTFIGMAVQELGVPFLGSLDLPDNYPFADILKDGMGFPALSNILTFGIAQILLFGALVKTVSMPSGKYTRGPQNLPGGFDGSSRTISGGYPFTTQIEDPEACDRTLNVEIQNRHAAMLGVTGAMMHLCLDLCNHHFFYPITHN